MVTIYIYIIYIYDYIRIVNGATTKSTYNWKALVISLLVVFCDLQNTTGFLKPCNMFKPSLVTSCNLVTFGHLPVVPALKPDHLDERQVT
jgi:hypothetical protein